MYTLLHSRKSSQVIGGLHSYLHHTILMFNPTNLEEVCVQATHIESKGKSAHDNFSSVESNQ